MAKESWTTFEFEAGALSASDLTVNAFEGSEALSEPYHFVIDAFPNSEEPLELRDFLGASACLRVARPQGEERFFNGVISRLELTSVSKGPAQYRFHLVPRLETLGNIHQSRIFQSLSIPDVVKKVLKEGKVEHRLDLRESYAVEEYCVQYRESNRDFVQRLLEDEGIFFYFEHASDKHVMVLVDSPKACPSIPRSEQLSIRFSQGHVPDQEHVFSFGRRRRVVPNTVVLKDFNFEKPTLDLLTKAQASEESDKLEVYDWPGGHDSDTEGKRRSKLRLEELRFGAHTCEAGSTCVSIAPGYVFEVDEKEGATAAKLMAVRVRHAGVKERAPGTAISEIYSNSVTAVDAGDPYRPLRKTACPIIAGLQTATVVGPGGEEIHPDSYGRIKVQFHWDREGKRDDHSSCWIRLAQPWAGAGMGTSVVPRIGQEVLVRFLEGDPDNPLALGAVYNGARPPAVKLPDDKTQSTLKTDTTQGSDGYNELLIEDSKDGEEIFLHGQKDHLIKVEQNKAQDVGRHEELEVGGNRDRTVTGNQDLTVTQSDKSLIQGNQSLKVVGTRRTITAQDHSEEVSRNQSVTVASQQVAVAMASSTEVLAAAALTVGGGLLINVGAAMNEAVGGAKLSEVGGASTEHVAGTRTRTVAKDSTSKIAGNDGAEVTKSVSVDVGADLKEDVGGKSKTLVKEQIGWMADTFKLKAQKLTIAVADKVALTIDKSGNVKFYGDALTVDGSKLKLKGSQIKKTGGGQAPSRSAETVSALSEKKTGTGSASWSKPKIEPGNEVTLDVKVQNIPDGKKAVITIHHCGTEAMVPGGKIDCEVKGGALVDKATGKPPVFKFGAKQLPWDPWDEPFFFYKATIEGLNVQTPAEKSKALRVKYFHVCLGDSWADAGGLTTGAEAAEIAGILGGVPESKAEARMMSMPNPTLPAWSGHFANTYAYHHGSHGTCQDRVTGKFINTKPPPKGFGDPPQCPVGNWRSVVILSKQAQFQYLALGDTEVRNETTFPSMPRYLAYLDCCLAGWEPSLGRAIVSRGTWYVIAFRRTIPDNDARAMARKFHKKWAQTHKLNPNKIRDLFFEVGAPYYASMRPVLISWRYEAILAPDAGLVERGLAAIGNFFSGVVNAIGSLFK